MEVGFLSSWVGMCNADTHHRRRCRRRDYHRNGSGSRKEHEPNNEGRARVVSELQMGGGGENPRKQHS